MRESTNSQTAGKETSEPGILGKDLRRATLLSAAVAGLLGAGVGCGSDDQAAPDGPKVLSVVINNEMTVEKFTSECDARGGLVQTHAACAGNNSCKGMSFNKFSHQLIEHTCKAMNTCGGMSCVVLPADTGRTGAEVFSTSCQGCHGSGKFTYYVPQGTDLIAAAQNFLQQPEAQLVNTVAFGSDGINSNGTSYANMPGFHEKYSRAEIERVVTYVRSLQVEAEEYGTLGVNEEVGDAGSM